MIPVYYIIITMADKVQTTRIQIVSPIRFDDCSWRWEIRGRTFRKFNEVYFWASNLPYFKEGKKMVWLDQEVDFIPHILINICEWQTGNKEDRWG